MKTNIKNFKTWTLSLALLLVAVSIVWVLVVRLEGEKPKLDLKLPSDHIGLSQELSFSVADTKSGLRQVWVGLIKDDKPLVLMDKTFAGSGFIGGGEHHSESFSLKIEPKTLGMADGKAILRIKALDYSWRGRFHGNLTLHEKEVTVDTKPPAIDVLTRFHNITQGGSGLIIYRLSEPCPETGVYVGEDYYPGYTGYFKDKQIAMALFALKFKQGPKTKMIVHAMDDAGNRFQAGFHHYIKRKAFRKDTLNISDRFLSTKMPEFEHILQKDEKRSPVDTFLKINRDLRESNYRKLMETIRTPDRKLHWSGRFLRLPKSARKAAFADHRIYRYQGKEIDQQFHMGIDLASLARSPVPAANSGKIVFSDTLGIYGNTIVIDHGFGLYSMYSHLSDMNVKTGQMVSKGDTIAKTGSTGLAGGDHLHFSMLVHHAFVNPVEWWDASWIENNVSIKLQEAVSN